MLASSVVREVRRAGIGIDALTPVGSLRRFAPEMRGVSLLGIVDPSSQKRVLKAFGRLGIVCDVTADTPSSVTASTERGDVTLHVTAPEHAGTSLVWHTGSSAHVRQLQERAEQHGARMMNGVLARPDGEVIPCSSEESFYERLGLPYIAPELRSGAGEIAAAASGQLPQLLTELDIRGDLHTHSSWSDGRDSIADMVGAARQIGYEYVAITDHSEHAWSSRKLAAREVPKQRQEIEALRGDVPGIEILHGVEVDIMPDGTLDFDDELLEGFDIVLASLHDHAGHDNERLTERYLRAIHHPLVNIITHPANRSPCLSAGYELDFDTLFAAAAQSGTAMEIDGAPGHLDMDGALARRAVAAGVTLAVDSDCHRIDGLARQMRFGVGTARRGWVEPRHVLNTRELARVRAFVAAKRGRP